jgi:hypothetical protein
MQEDCVWEKKKKVMFGEKKKVEIGCSSRSRLLNGRNLGWDTYCCGV